MFCSIFVLSPLIGRSLVLGLPFRSERYVFSPVLVSPFCSPFSFVHWRQSAILRALLSLLEDVHVHPGLVSHIRRTPIVKPEEFGTTLHYLEHPVYGPELPM